jgi:Holliday junction resolvase-like predicted endonuclease
MTLPLRISKSSRHSKITGDFGEALVLYWLSKHGFECASVDHTGIDLIARNPHTKEIMGISVKSRSRNVGTESTSVDISNENFEKAESACRAFGCIPYFAIVVDAGDSIKGFILSMAHLLELFPIGKAVCAWKMSPKFLQKYYRDRDIKVFEFQAKTKTWWS